MKDRPKIRLFNVINGILFILISIIMLIPIYKVLVDSFDLSSAYGMRLWPKQFGLAGYASVLSNPTLYRPLLISVGTTLVGTFFGLALSTLGAYVLIQWDMPGRTFFANFLLFTMIFNGGMIPTYLVMKNLGLTNNLLGVVLLPAIKDCILDVDMDEKIILVHMLKGEECGMEDFSINEMQKMQRSLQDKYKDRWEPICPETGQNKMLWMVGEIGEVIDIVKKHGAVNALTQEELRKDLVEEMADVLMYYNDVMLCYGITADELKQAYTGKFEKNMKRW